MMKSTIQLSPPKPRIADTLKALFLSALMCCWTGPTLFGAGMMAFFPGQAEYLGLIMLVGSLLSLVVAFFHSCFCLGGLTYVFGIWVGRESLGEMRWRWGLIYSGLLLFPLYLIALAEGVLSVLSSADLGQVGFGLAVVVNAYCVFGMYTFLLNRYQRRRLEIF